MGALDDELGIFFPWSCIYPLADFKETPNARQTFTDLYPRAAEYWVAKCFDAHLRTIYQIPECRSQYVNERSDYRPYNVVLQVMQEKFKNVFGEKSLRAFSAGGAASKLRAGRARKPDVFAFGIKDGVIHIEFLEVTTEGRAAIGQEQLRSKVDLMKQLQPEIEERLRRLNERAAGGAGRTIYPSRLSIHPASWKPRRSQLRYPLLRGGMEPMRETLERVEWICLKPTFRSNGGQGVDGLVLYEVHRVKGRRPVPDEVRQRLRQHVARARAQHQRLLDTDANAFWTQNAVDLAEMQMIATVAGAVAIVIVFMVIMPEFVAPFLVGASTVGAEGVLLGGEAAALTAGAEATLVGAEAAASAGLAEGAVVEEVQVMTRIAASSTKVRVAEAIPHVVAEVEELAESAETLLRTMKLPTP